MWVESREPSWIVHATALLFAGRPRGEICYGTDTWEALAETPDKAKQGDKQPEAPQQASSNRAPAIAVSLAALAIIGAATANALPNFHFSLPSFNRPSLPSFSGFSLPNFSRFTAPSHETASVRIPDPIVNAALRDIQLSQKDIQSSEQQNASALVSLTQSSANQQADLK